MTPGSEGALDGAEDGDNNRGTEIPLSGSGSASDAGALDEEFEGAVTPGNATPDGTDDGSTRAGGDSPLSGRGGVVSDTGGDVGAVNEGTPISGEGVEEGAGTPTDGNGGRPIVGAATPLIGALVPSDGTLGT